MSEKFSVEEFTATGGILIPKLCERHRHDLIVRQLHVTPTSSPGHMAWTVIASILLFQGAVVDEKFRATTDGSTGALNLFLRSIECPACWKPALYRLVVRVCKRGFDHAARVGKMDLHDDDFSRWLGRSSDKSRT